MGNLVPQHFRMGEMLDIKRSGDFGSVHIVSDPIGQEYCQFALYKDKRDIPEESYTRIGKENPTLNNRSFLASFDNMPIKE